MVLLKKAVNKLEGKHNISVEMADSYRLLLVAKARWLIIGLLVAHWVIGFSTYIISDNLSTAELTYGLFLDKALEIGAYPALLMFAVVAVNAFLHIGWYKLPSFWKNRAKLFLYMQISLDVLVVLALIHFTGGVTSWLWPLFLIINIELIYLFSSRKTIFLMGSLAGIGYTVLAILEYSKVLAIHPMPYLPQDLQYNFTLVVLILIWVNLICGFSLHISVYMRRGEQIELREKIIRDDFTHLYNKKYFFDRLNSEILRSKVYNRVFSLILFQIDNDREYFENVGKAQHRELLRWISEVMRMNIRKSEDEPAYDLDIAAYLGGARFAILLPETGAEQPRSVRDMSSDAEIFGAAAYTVAKRINATVNASKFTYGSKVTVSASVVSYPIDGINFKEIMKSAYNGLSRAGESGNTVVIVSQKEDATIELSTN